MTEDFDRQLRRLLAEEEASPDEAAFAAEVTRRVSATRQRAGWEDVEKLLSLVGVPMVVAIAAWVVAPALVIALAPAALVIGASAAGSVLPLLVASAVIVYAWRRSLT